jgi:sodium/potassium-transporting ATPase subunit beta
VYKKEDKEAEKNRIDCDFNNPPKDGKVCRVDISSAQFQSCTKENQYGYSSGAPCVFLKLNKVKLKN